MPRGDARIRTEDGALNQIAERLRSRRRVLKLTQETLCARLADVSSGRWVANRKEIVHLEAGTRIVSDIELLMLAKALGCSPAWLLTGEAVTTTTVSAPPHDGE
jgi:transcriptional regulator with XRE-family HTH domain